MFSRSQREADWLADIVDNARAAESYVAGLTFGEWREDRMRIDAVERCLMRLTEAAIRIGDARLKEVTCSVMLMTASTWRWSGRR